MHHYEKLTFDETRDYRSLPDIKLHVLECPQCHYRIPVPPEYTDWKEVAARYRKAYEGMVSSFDVLLKEAGEQFDVPLVEYAEVNRQIWIAELKAILEQMGGDQK